MTISDQNNPLCPLVTIAIPTLNRAHYLRIALGSALAQTYSNLEIVVSNNACTDSTAALLASINDPRLRVLTQPSTISMMENWNACVRAATGKYFLLLSDDDVLEPAAIEELVNAFEDSERRGESIGFVYCGGTMIDQNGATLSLGKKAPPLETAREIIAAFFAGKRSTFICGTLLRKEDLGSGYDHLRFPLAADVALWVRIVVAYGAVRFVDRAMVHYREHANVTLKTPLEDWYRDHITSSEFAIAELQKVGDIGDNLPGRIRKSIRRINVSLTPDLINRSLRHHKLAALREYWRYRSMFASAYGLRVLMRGLTLMMLPDFFRAWVRRRLYSKSSESCRGDGKRTQL